MMRAMTLTTSVSRNNANPMATRPDRPLSLASPNWVATVNSYGPIVNRGGGPFASLRQGKYDTDDTFQLQQFDSTLPPNGNWKALGDYQNISS